MEESLQTIKGVGPKREKQLHRLGIHSISSLLNYFPRTYEDRTKIYSINELKVGDILGVVGHVVSVQEKRPRPRLSILEVAVTDGTGHIKFVLFNQGYKKNFYKKGQKIYGYGKVEQGYGSLQMNTPQIELLGPNSQAKSGIVSVYPLVEGVNQFVVRQTLANWFQANSTLPEILPLEVGRIHAFMPRYEAFKEIHFPSSIEKYEKAHHQLAYEELFIMQSGLAMLRHKQRVYQGFSMEEDGPLMAAFKENLPFTLTGDQERALQDISLDMQGDKPMQRLVQGDVGSGKTVVAILAMLKAVENGYQACLMAPTEILAQQHIDSFKDLCKGLDIKVALLTGSVKDKDKKKIYEELETGAIQILIGTHALIQDSVNFKKLALAIVDEQHRFGVEQRAKLQKKGQHPHMLIMTATPIPRTMTLSIYGDLSVSLIKEMPPGRKPVLTYVVDSSYKKRLLRFFAKEMSLGHQVYVVCPLVEESETLDLKAAEDLYLELQDYYRGHFKVGLVHGRMKPDEKEEVMDLFSQGYYSLLVSTTVIEVGVNVPNATIMCVEGAQRFGLSQLHQLRGRVGRGSQQSYCVLISDSKSDVAQERLKLMETIYDGFELAEQDLLLRGSGQLFGLAQSGLPDLRVANIIKDIEILIQARKDVFEYVATKGIDVLQKEMEIELKSRFGEKFLRIMYS